MAVEDIECDCRVLLQLQAVRLCLDDKWMVVLVVDIIQPCNLILIFERFVGLSDLIK